MNHDEVSSMSSPLTILLADDQVPWNSKAEDDRVKEEIRREFSIVKPHLDVDAAFADDTAWFTGLLEYLEQTKGEKVIRARTFEEAKRHIEHPRDSGIDVAMVDLSWWGDYTLPQGATHRHNRGIKLLEVARDGVSKVPIVSLSQNFSDTFELISTVLERGALPVPKNYQNRQLGYRALYAAVQYLTKERRRSKVEVFVSHAHEDEDLATRIVRAIDLGLQVPPEGIRCTSLPGYEFKPGTHFIQALRDELTGASCVVGLWTASSMKSQWCLFELGAAWGLTRKALFLSLGGDTLREAPAGFRSIQVSHLGDSGQLRRFLDELARITGWSTKNRPAAERELDNLAQFVKRSVEEVRSRPID
jgi:hypothetical protein